MDAVCFHVKTTEIIKQPLLLRSSFGLKTKLKLGHDLMSKVMQYERNSFMRVSQSKITSSPPAEWLKHAPLITFICLTAYLFEKGGSVYHLFGSYSQAVGTCFCSILMQHEYNKLLFYLNITFLWFATVSFFTKTFIFEYKSWMKIRYLMSFKNIWPQYVGIFITLYPVIYAKVVLDTYEYKNI